MFRLIPIVLLLALLFFGVSWLRKLPPGKQRQAVVRALCYLLLGTLVFLLITGKIHWLGAALGALIPMGKLLFGLGFKFLPFLQRYRATQTPPPEPKSASANISLDEALLTLGVKDAFQMGTLTVHEVEQAHKRLIQKLHPDRGGNDYLAARINMAKSCILKALG
ncbi:J domain-containing protein [Gilvimarinus polysaccharolyticus]|uniref:hypothetical protein n=1 Tax=Gilvimarinus polysaccharolyticus TaxID=863921 RepID=UPI000673A18B|nr:hypothetical protein [Gilvimarinus polysaccharolyticus]